MIATNLTMRLILVLSALAVASVNSAPVVVWSSLKGKECLHNSAKINASTAISEALKGHVDEENVSSLESVIFVVGRGDDGSESFTNLAASGKLPAVAQKYNDAHIVHHNVDQVESIRTIANAARDAVPSLPRNAIVEASLDEFYQKLSSKNEAAPEGRVTSQSEKHGRKRFRSLLNARVLVVKVAPEDANKLDDAVVKAVDNVKSVVLTAIRSAKEVHLERKMTAAKHLDKIQTNAVNHRRRRLEDANFDDGYYQADEDMTGVYYVNMTPNILSGIIFFLLFTSVAITGISCLNMIQGQDVYVKKLPPVGREA